MPFRSALITGASSGIGAAFARALPAETDLLLGGRDRAALDRLAGELARPGRRVEPVAADLATAAGRETVIAAAQAFEPDLLVNNAGFGVLAPMIDNDAAVEHDMVAVNCLAVVELTRALVPGMIARAADHRRAGLIIVSSTVAFAPLPFMATYAATKAFDLFLGAALAEELRGRPIDVLALCPGGTDTAFAARAGTPGRRTGVLARKTAARVAREGLAALGRRPVHIVGAGNRLLIALAAIAPRRLAGPLVGRVMRRTLAVVSRRT